MSSCSTSICPAAAVGPSSKASCPTTPRCSSSPCRCPTPPRTSSPSSGPGHGATSPRRSRGTSCCRRCIEWGRETPCSRLAWPDSSSMRSRRCGRWRVEAAGRGGGGGGGGPGRPGAPRPWRPQRSRSRARSALTPGTAGPPPHRPGVHLQGGGQGSDDLRQDSGVARLLGVAQAAALHPARADQVGHRPTSRVTSPLVPVSKAGDSPARHCRPPAGRDVDVVGAEGERVQRVRRGGSPCPTCPRSIATRRRWPPWPAGPCWSCAPVRPASPTWGRPEIGWPINSWSKN